MPYTPRPADLSDVQLPAELLPLVEQIARNVHEVWAQKRLSQGWTLGPERSDKLKTHPSHHSSTTRFSPAEVISYLEPAPPAMISVVTSAISFTVSSWLLSFLTVPGAILLGLAEPPWREKVQSVVFVQQNRPVVVLLPQTVPATLCPYMVNVLPLVPSVVPISPAV